MGVPKFYRWLSERYPCINQAVSKSLKPEFDNLYLDMNGIVHNCTHSNEDVKTRLSEDQMFSAIFKYIDKLVNIARPQKVLYMAIDGVAPRAKMNQQRQRRFRSAQDAASALEEQRRAGTVIPEEDRFDSNCITPGTEFMAKLSKHLQFFVRKKMKEDSLWQNMEVIFSGAEVPGEGEHKIMAYIRNTKMQPNYNPNTRHCLYGLDADLIMLALVSHEPHFALLREEVVFGSNRTHDMPRKAMVKLDVFQFLHISLLREYLDLEFGVLRDQLSFGYDLERIIDDWVFLCMLVGNDFLPHLPTLDIFEGGLDKLFDFYRENLPTMGYLTDNGEMIPDRVERIFAILGKLEPAVFEQRILEEAALEKKHKRNRNHQTHTYIPDDVVKDSFVSKNGFEDMALEDEEEKESSTTATDTSDTEAVDLFIEAFRMDSGTSQSQQKPIQSNRNRSRQPQEDTPQEDEHNFRERYYHDKYIEYFVNLEEKRVYSEEEVQRNIRNLVSIYFAGLNWVLKYYYSGCASWVWYFPFRYAPLASDMVNLSEIDLTLQLGKPFNPLEQLLGVLPPQSAQFLPEAYQKLMTAPSSSVLDYYPTDFDVDMNGKKNPWEGIALIPFIDETRLLDAVHSIDPKALNAEETKRNQNRDNCLLYYYDKDNKDTIESTLPRIFRDIDHAESAVKPYVLPNIPGDGKFRSVLLKGVQMPCPGYPTLNTFPLTAALTKAKVTVFSRPSRKVTVSITLSPNPQPQPEQPVTLDGVSDVEDVSVIQPYLGYVGKTVFMDWPYLREAYVVSVSTEFRTVTSNGSMIHNYNQRTKFTNTVSELFYSHMNSRAVNIGVTDVLFRCKPLVGMTQDASGAVVKDFADDLEEVIPSQLIVYHNKNADPRFVERPPATLKDVFPMGQPLIYIGPEWFGSMATVVGHDITNNLCSLEVRVSPKEPPFGPKLASLHKVHYYPAGMIARELDCHPSIIGKLTGTVSFKPGRLDFGLKLKFTKSQHQAPGFSRRADKGWKSGSEDGQDKGFWEYSELTVRILALYKKRFPGLFDLLNSNPNATSYNLEDLPRYQECYQEAEEELRHKIIESVSSLDPEEQRKANIFDDDGNVVFTRKQQNVLHQVACSRVSREILAFLDTMEIGNIVLVPYSSTSLNRGAIHAIESEGAKYHEATKDLQLTKVVVSNVPLHYMYGPSPKFHWTPSKLDEFHLGDRVMSLRSDEGIPFGLRGVVVALHVTHAEVVFDTEMMSGTSLHSMCSNFRGRIVSLTSLLNLTRPQILKKKADNAAFGEIEILEEEKGEPFDYAFNPKKPKPIHMLSKHLAKSKNKEHYGRGKGGHREIHREYEEGGRRGGQKDRHHDKHKNKHQHHHKGQREQQREHAHAQKKNKKEKKDAVSRSVSAPNPNPNPNPNPGSGVTHAPASTVKPTSQSEQAFWNELLTKGKPQGPVSVPAQRSVSDPSAGGAIPTEVQLAKMNEDLKNMLNIGSAVSASVQAGGHRGRGGRGRGRGRGGRGGRGRGAPRGGGPRPVPSYYISEKPLAGSRNSNMNP